MVFYLACRSLLAVLLLGIVSTAGSVSGDADFESVRRRLSSDHSGKASDPQQKYFRKCKFRSAEINFLGLTKSFRRVDVSRGKLLKCSHSMILTHSPIAFTRITMDGKSDYNIWDASDESGFLMDSLQLAPKEP